MAETPSLTLSERRQAAASRKRRRQDVGSLGDHQARVLLTAPGHETVKEKRDRAILSTLLFHALRREELCKLNCIELTTRSPATGKVG